MTDNTVTARREVLTRAKTLFPKSFCLLQTNRIKAAIELEAEGHVRCWVEDYNGRQILVCKLLPRPPRPIGPFGGFLA
jgi:hypothetical protein